MMGRARLAVMRRLPLLLAVVACAPSERAAQPPGGGDLRFTFTYPDIPAGAVAEPPAAISAPDPDNARVFASEAIFHKGLHINRTYFCVHPSGVTEAITTVVPARAPGLDALMRETIAAWTFKPAQFQGKPTRACTRVETKFRIV
jgi:hypothetical protein